MKKQAFNPYLPSYEYIPDGEPHIFDGRLYVYGSHDRFNGWSFCLNDYVCWSADINDLSSWRHEGVIYRREQEPYSQEKGKLYSMAAPDVCRGADGRYYLYYFIGANSRIAVSVCNQPAGRYEFYGYVHYADGFPIGSKNEPFQFDPGIFIDDDGKIYLYTGFGLDTNPILLQGHKPTLHGPMCFELEQDMLTVKTGPLYIGIKGKYEARGTPYEGHAFLEASSMRKFNGCYYFIYSSLLSHELCYAVSDNPCGGFTFGGILVSNGDIGLNGRAKRDALNYTGNTHGSLIEINGKYYVFYHRQTNRNQFSRQACAEEIRFENGHFHQAEITSCGLNGAPLIGKGKYEARIACNLFGKHGARWYWALKGPKGNHPYFTQTGKDREDKPTQYIANMCDGATAGFKYFQLEVPAAISIKLRGTAEGEVLVRTELGGEQVARIKVKPCKRLSEFKSGMAELHGKYALYFTFYGKGSFDFTSFRLL